LLLALKPYVSMDLGVVELGGIEPPTSTLPVLQQPYYNRL